MPRQTTTLPLALPARAGRTSVHDWLCSAVRAAILDRRIAPGARLPATRDFAREYGVARGTVVAAFEQLEAEGYLHGLRGSGTFVSRVLPDELLHAPRLSGPAVRNLTIQRRHLSATARRAQA